MSLKRITDFDLGVGGSEEDFIRVSEIPVDVSRTEINLITWLLVEQEFRRDGLKLKPNSGPEGWKEQEQVSDEDEHLEFDGPNEDNSDHQLPVVGPGGDTTDTVRIPPTCIQVGYGFTPRLIAKKYAEAMLRAVGVSLPFELLTDAQRGALFRYFSSQSDLLKQEKYSSIIDLYQVLRKRSKFREQYDVLRVLGKGAFGVVYAVQTKQADTEPYEFAIKKISISSFDAYADINMVLNEANILQRLGQHPNIIRYIDAWLEVHEDERESEPLVPVFYLMMELAHIPLDQWKTENPHQLLSAECILAVTRQLLLALEWIHDRKCLHLDINPRNILWSDTSYSSVKIADFGLGIPGETCPIRRGTAPYLGPESGLSAKSDVYSLGVTLLEISQNISTKSELVNRIESKQLRTGVPIMDKILPLMLRKQLSQRPTASELLAITGRS